MLRYRITLGLALALSALVLVGVTGCSKASTQTQAPAESAAAAQSSLSGAELGKQIYLKGLGSDGQEIAASAPAISQGALLLGGGGCAACHGTNGHGGTVRSANGAAISAPNITYGELIKGGFKDATIRWAIMWCQDETGAMLDETMPCWQMSEADAEATVAYLKTLK